MAQIDRRASRDIRELFGYVNERSGAASATRWIEGLLKRIDSLDIDAEVWPLTEIAALAELGVRELLYRRHRFAYRIFYCIEGDTVVVRRIRSASQEDLTPDDI